MENIQDWLKDINFEELPEPYKTIAYKTGIKNVFILAEMYQGTHIYLPKLDNVIKSIRDKKIRQEFRGYNYKELAIKYKLTEIWIRQIVSEERHPDQITMDELV